MQPCCFQDNNMHKIQIFSCSIDETGHEHEMGTRTMAKAKGLTLDDDDGIGVD